jgi:polysaccharide biosynthesis/export protein
MRFLQIALLLAIASSCASTPKIVGNEALSIVPGNVLPPPSRGDYGTAPVPFVIGPLDKLKIDVFGIEEMTKEIQTDASGRITFPLIGTLDAAGKTPGELAAAIETGLRGRYVKNPQVSVNLIETVSQVVTVDGEVKEPGLYPAVGNMTLMRAVAAANGTSEFAKLNDVVVFRTVGDKKMAALYDLKSIRRGAYDDPRIYPNDVVVVGNSQARRIFRDFLSLSPLLSGPIIAVLSNRN